MKRIILTLTFLALIASSAFADVFVHGYQRQDGTYVAPHYRSDPNSSTYDNWSTKGNFNPYTGQPGSRSQYGIY